MLAQLACDVKVIRPVSRTVFFPVPNVDSVLRRACSARGPAPEPSLRALVQQGFAHRRKALRALASRSRAATATPSAPRSRRSGCPADARAEALAPEQWRALHARLA